MNRSRVGEPLDFETWRSLARERLNRGMKPEEVVWADGAAEQGAFDLFSPSTNELPAGDSRSIFAGSRPSTLAVDKEFVELARAAAHARDDDRWDLLYRILYRLRFENSNLMKISIDEDVLRLKRLARNVARDIHKMHAFVRFKSVKDEALEAGERYVAWHEPEHRILKLASPFFARRFGDRAWSIFTPEGTAHWDLEQLTYGPAIEKSEFRFEDEMDESWRTYYGSIFNPARTNPKAMQAEMPVKFWKNLPEADLIRDLVRESAPRLEELARRRPRQAEVPAVDTWPELRAVALKCQACPLYESATQVVFGEGPLDAKIMIVGEQPGDAEDRTGRAFIGPAGEVLSQALDAAGLDRSKIYLTNAVKHFKWKPAQAPDKWKPAQAPDKWKPADGEDGRSEKVRLHQKPTGTEMHACRPWLEAELELIEAEVVILLGATAGTSVLGRLPRVGEERGRWIDLPRARSGRARRALLSWHPSAILRATSQVESDRKLTELIADLELAANAFPVASVDSKSAH